MDVKILMIGYEETEVIELSYMIEKLNGKVIRSKHWDFRISHLLTEEYDTKKTMILAALAAGKNIVSKKFIHCSYKAGKFLEEEKFQLDPVVQYHKIKWELDGCGIFSNMNVIFFIEDKKVKDEYERLILAGGGNYIDKISIAIRSIKRGEEKITHNFFDPWLDKLIEKSISGRKFLKWTHFEKKSKNQSYKVDYSFIRQKLIKPLDVIREEYYRIGLDSVKFFARKRRENRMTKLQNMEPNQMLLEEYFIHDDYSDAKYINTKKEIEHKNDRVADFSQTFDGNIAKIESMQNVKHVCRQLFHDYEEDGDDLDDLDDWNSNDREKFHEFCHTIFAINSLDKFSDYDKTQE